MKKALCLRTRLSLVDYRFEISNQKLLLDLTYVMNLGENLSKV